MSGRRVQLPHVNCPACGGRAFAKTVGKKSLLFRELYYACRNPDACGHGFVVEMMATRTTTPSRYPSPLHKLPMTTWRDAANDRAANDDGPPNEPASSATVT
jgi:DNA-directed RNA polymerase subunit RPC12/RpoP